MNKTAIKNFAIWARRKLISDVTYKASMLGITESGIAQPMSQSTPDLQFLDIGTKDYVQISGEEIKQRNALIAVLKNKEKVSDYKTAFQSIVEEVAYTWFNRLIAIRFMEVNDYLPSHIRVLSSENEGKLEPDFVSNPFETDLEFSPYEKDLVFQLKDENRLDELFRVLCIKQCNKLGEILPGLFEQIADYTELLLNISFSDQDGIIYHLTHDISEDDFNVEKEGQVEIIGWLYQYYNTEPKDEVFALLKKNVKITKERIPAATQLFTPDWIVRYMVENSLGRLWVEGHPSEELKSNWKYYLEEAEQEPEVRKQLEEIYKEHSTLNPEDIKVIDPCMGSGHILVYAFEVLMQIYLSHGYTQKDAAISILKNNLYGIDIDYRAYQLAYFAVMMKARQYNRRILNENITPNLIAVKNPSDISLSCLKHLGSCEKTAKQLLSDFTDVEEYGSIINISYSESELESLGNKLQEINATIDETDMLERMEIIECRNVLEPLIRQAQIMNRKYDVVVTNPPYMGAKGMSAKLGGFLQKNYSDYKSDLFSAFVIKCTQMAKQNGFSAFLTPYVWMFIQSYEKMRKYIYAGKTIETLIQFEYSAFQEATVPICTFALRNRKIEKRGAYLRLTDFRGGMEVQKEKTLLAVQNHKCGYYYATQSDNFTKIPGSPVAYWVSEKFCNAFKSGVLLGTIADSKQGLATADNNRFLRLWFEVKIHSVKFDAMDIECARVSGKKWFPYNKGGIYRKWYGNNDYVVNWENDGYEIKNFNDKNGKQRSRPQNTSFYFKPSVSWSLVSSGSVAFRYKKGGGIFDVAGMSFFSGQDLLYLLGLVNTTVILKYLGVLAPTINYQCGDIAALPVYVNNNHRKNIEHIVKCNILISIGDWDSFETSWDFVKHPLLNGEKNIKSAYQKWESECDERFNQLKANEEELNRIFIDIYGLQDELTSEVEDKDVTVRKADLSRDIKSFISYAVGCMFGRYSLDTGGLAYAGGDWADSKYKTFMPDEDNCIPITDQEYFSDDIVGRFVEFVRVVYSEETLEDNLDYIAEALGNRGNTSRETIRKYFLNDFFADHCQTYSVTGSGNRPIYWLFDSGKENGFKALVYMHRWNADTVGNLRVEYLHKMQNIYEREMDTCQDIIDNSMNNREIAIATKRKEKLVKQMKECKDYDARIAHIALSRIDIDLDDGVKVNYRKVQTGADGRFCEILADSKNIMIKENSDIWQNLISNK